MQHTHIHNGSHTYYPSLSSLSTNLPTYHVAECQDWWNAPVFGGDDCSCSKTMKRRRTHTHSNTHRHTMDTTNKQTDVHKGFLRNTQLMDRRHEHTHTRRVIEPEDDTNQMSRVVCVCVCVVLKTQCCCILSPSNCTIGYIRRYYTHTHTHS